MMHEHGLTLQELEAAYFANFDLASGYPQLPVANYIKNLYRNPSIIERSLRVSPICTPEERLYVDQHLEEALVNFLGCSNASYRSISTTFSGAIALDRSIAAALKTISRDNDCSTYVVTTSPSIDIMRLLLEEHKPSVIRFVESRNGYVGSLDRNAILAQISEISRLRKQFGLIVLLTSPENPTGEIWSRDDIAAIAAATSAQGGVLIVDHSFLVAGIHDTGAVPAVWDVLPADMNWIALWDTGKTFGLNEDKLGFIISGSPKLASAVQASLNVIQYGVARRQKLLFTSLLQSSYSLEYVKDLQQACRKNLIVANSLTSGREFRVRAPKAGSLVLLELLDTKCTDDDIRHKLMTFGVGVTSGNVFFHTQWRPRSYIRLALARTPEYFEAALARTMELLSG